jgi:hypothetical protein
MHGILSLSGNANKVKAADSGEEKQAESDSIKNNKPVHDYIIKNFVAEEGTQISHAEMFALTSPLFVLQIRTTCIII